MPNPNPYLLLPDIPSHDPRGLNTLCSSNILSRTRRMARGRGMRRWWNWADSGRDSKSCQVMLGGNQIAGDQKAAEMDVIDRNLKQTTIHIMDGQSFNVLDIFSTQGKTGDYLNIR